MTADIKGLLKHYTWKVKTFLFSRDVLTFLLFLAISFLFWFANSLDKERTVEIRIPIHYLDFPAEIELKNPTANLKVKINDKAAKLLYYSRTRLASLSLDMPRNFSEKGKIVFTPTELKAKAAKIFLPSTAILSISPDTLAIEYKKLHKRTLPVELDAEILPARQHVLTGVKISPDTISVFGEKTILDSLVSIKTKRFVFKNLKDSINVRCELASVAGVKSGISDVQVTLLPEMFTEKKLQIPVSVINKPANVKVKTFPATVEVTLNVGISSFNSVDSSDIRVLFDYAGIARGSASHKLSISYTNSHVLKTSILPSEVEYILEFEQ